MKLTTTNKRFIDEVPWGLYVWEMPDGSWVGDDQGNFLNIPSTRGNKGRIQKLKDAARACGVTEGHPVYLSGNRQVDDEEYENQKRRLAFGLVPDELDIAAIREEEAK